MRSATIAAAFCLVATIAGAQVGVWEEAASLGEARAYLAAATVDGHVYTVGGIRTWPPLSFVEAYDPSRDVWSERQPLPVPRMALAVVGLGGRLYAVGGANHSAWIDRVDVYDPGADRWTERSPLPAARGYAGAAAAFGRLYIIGGGTARTRRRGSTVTTPRQTTGHAWPISRPLGREARRAHCAAKSTSLEGGTRPGME